MFFSEVLCFLRNNYGKMPKSNLVGSISSFYTEDELVTDKACLFDFAEGISDIDNLPRNKVRKTGDAKRRLDNEDMLALLETLDRNKVVMPTFGVANLRRLPPLSASDVDVYKLAITVSELSKQVSTTDTVFFSLQIEDQLKYNTDRNHCVSPMNQLLITLRFYATGTFQLVLADLIHIDKSTACRIIHKVTAAIAKLCPKYVPIQSPGGVNAEIYRNQNGGKATSL